MPALRAAFGSHGDHGLVVLVHTGESHHGGGVLTELAAYVEHGLAQGINRTEVAHVLDGHLDGSSGVLGVFDQSRNSGGELGLVHGGKSTVGFLSLASRVFTRSASHVRTGVELVGQLETARAHER